MPKVQIGFISKDVANALELSHLENAPIFLGDSNIEHMQRRHFNDYVKYQLEIINIIIAPDYVGVNAKDNSIEFVKEFAIDGEFVKVAVRVSQNNILYARSLYVLNKNRVNNFIEKGTLKKVKK